MRERHQRNGLAGTAIRRHRNAQYRDGGHRRNRDLGLGSTLIFRVALLQTGVLVDSLAAIAVVIVLRKCHGRRRRGLDAGICNADCLGKKHPCREEAADCTTISEIAKDHQSLFVNRKAIPILGEGQEQCRGELMVSCDRSIRAFWKQRVGASLISRRRHESFKKSVGKTFADSVVDLLRYCRG